MISGLYFEQTVGCFPNTSFGVPYDLTVPLHLLCISFDNGEQRPVRV